MTARLNRRTTALLTDGLTADRPDRRRARDLPGRCGVTARRLSVVLSAVLSISTIGVPAPAPASADVDPIDVLPITGYSGWDFAEGYATQIARDLLADAANFGASGVVDREVVLHPAVTTAQLD